MTSLVERTPVSRAITSLIGCALRANALLLRRRLRQPTEHHGCRLTFADGTTGVVYRETQLRHAALSEPALLVVGFRLRLITSSRAHAAFRAESLLNTVLFVGFRGFVSKLWLRHDENGLYRGFYQWDGVALAERYVGSLRHLLDLVSEPHSVTYHVIPGLVRDEVLRRPGEITAGSASSPPPEWCRLVDVQPPL